MGTEPVRIQPSIRFGKDFELNVRSCELRRGDDLVPLERRPMDLLLLLIQHRDRLVTREEIVERLWEKGVFVDTENGIHTAVRKIRQALKDDPEDPQFIRTFPGRGYRFISPVNEHAKTAEERPLPHIVQPVTARRISRRGPVRIVVMLMVVAAASYFLTYRIRTAPRPVTRRMMLAVLPFENLTGDPGQEYFSDGFTEEIITQLGRLDPQRLGVIARTSVMRYKNSHVPLPGIGADLGVQYVLEGSIRREGERLRITAQLIRVRDQTHVWARGYDRELKDLLDVQTEIAQEIGDEIELALGDGQTKHAAARRSLSPQELHAYDLYLNGEYFFAKRSVPDLHKAIDFFQQATAEDPRYARAWAGLADCYSLLGGYSAVPQTEYVAKARTAALRALELDDRLPEAHTALALIVQNYDWDWQTAEREFRRAIELDPNYATAHHWYAEHLMWRGRFDQALRESEKARQLDPLSLIIATDNAVIYYYSRRYDVAIRRFRGVLELDPDFPRAQMIRYAYAEKGEFREALASFSNRRIVNKPYWYWSNLAYIEGSAGHLTEAHRALQNLLRMSREQDVDPAVLTWAYLGIGDKQRAITSLEQAYAKHSNLMTSLKVEPAFDPLRGDPRFQDLLRRVGLDHN